MLNQKKLNTKMIEKLVEQNHVLWADTPMFLTGNQTASLTEKISEQKSGIVVVWSEYSGGQAQNYGWQYLFIPKHHVASADSNMQGVSQIMVGYNFGNIGTKYYYVHDTKIEGHSSNNATGTGSGITYTNNHWVLRYVIGV